MEHMIKQPTICKPQEPIQK